jgi:transcriptional regulator with XRE-family HTH domain
MTGGTLGGVEDAATVIRRARRQAGLTQAALAARAGVTQPVVAAYETGRRDPTLPTLRKLLAAAGYGLDLSLRRRLTDQQVADELQAVLDLADALPRRHRPELEAPAFHRR